MSDKRPIGIFDSGVGGLTVVKEMRRVLPGEDIIYFGDTAHVPYGAKSKETIKRFSIENVNFLLKYNVKLIVVACNTSSSVALPLLRRSFKVPIVGVVMPGARRAAALSGYGKIGLIGTRTTISSGAYEKALKKVAPKLKVISKPCPLFVSLAEEGWTSHRLTRLIAKEYLAPLKKAKVKSLILGCTHYPLLYQVIKREMGKGVRLVDSARSVADETAIILRERSLLTSARKGGMQKFFVSDEPMRFAGLGKRFLGKKLKYVRKA
ncbi:MAG: glutamate racemase [Candidatus Omnitrophica bacterium]|nr:glutamate racemase [Candidatus Omnitrophota bacterium]